MGGGDVEQVLAWDQVGPVALLVVGIVALFRMFLWVLNKLITDKDTHIERLMQSNKDLRDEIGATLDSILTAIKDQAAERRRNR
jgi:cell division protein FtsL